MLLTQVDNKLLLGLVGLEELLTTCILKRKLEEFPEYYFQVIKGLLETLKQEVVIPLLRAEDLKEEMRRTRDSFTLLRIVVNSYVLYIWQKHPEEMERWLEEGIKEFEDLIKEKGRELLNEEALETFLGAVRLSFSTVKDLLKLSKYPQFSLLLSPYEIGLNLALYFHSISFPLLGEVEPIGKQEKNNIQTIVLLMREGALKYTFEFYKSLKLAFSSPENAKLPEEFYTEKIKEFIGNGPKGVYKALLEARQEERMKVND